MKVMNRFRANLSIFGFRARRKLIHLYVYATARDFAHKVRQRMKYDRNPLFVTLADKYAVKAYAQARGVKTAELYHVTTQPDTIPFEQLPERYFIKANHGWNWNILHRDGAFYFFNNQPAMSLPGANTLPHVTQLSREACLELCEQWLASTYNSGEWVYQAIEPKIIVEEMLEDAHYSEMCDYRFFTFNGLVKVIEFDNDAYRQNDKGFFADRMWREFPISEAESPPFRPQRPENLEEMIEVAERLAQGSDFLRVDLYNTTKGIYLGEITLFPEAGGIKSPSHSPTFNKWLGDQWVLDKRHFRRGRGDLSP